MNEFDFRTLRAAAGDHVDTVKDDPFGFRRSLLFRVPILSLLQRYIRLRSDIVIIDRAGGVLRGRIARVRGQHAVHVRERRYFDRCVAVIGRRDERVGRVEQMRADVRDLNDISSALLRISLGNNFKKPCLTISLSAIR